MTYEEWLVGLGQYRTEHPTQRAGQAAFNFLAQEKPYLAGLVEGTVIDPFNFQSDDRRDKVLLKEFFNFVKVNWEDHD